MREKKWSCPKLAKPSQSPRETTNEKADHVRRAKRSGRHGGHTCHWPGCGKNVPPAMWGCLAHWKLIPKDLQRKLWNAYVIGQEKTKIVSREYVQVAREIQEWIREHYSETRNVPGH